MSQTNNKQIAKNAAALYFRMIIMMIIGFYTARIILNALGVDDYGIYNVVGGFVSMFSLISGSLVSSISRSLTFELGIGNNEKLKKTFSTSIIVLLCLSTILVVLIEIIGVWYINNKMVIPHDRLYAAHWCFQFSVVTFLLGLINTPYSASIVSHERMDVYAYLTIFDAVFKLLICFAIVHSPIDRLIMYSILLSVVSLVNQIIYVLFCKKHFVECNFKWEFDCSLFKSLFSFAGWNFIGSSASVLRNQGATLLLNWAGGPAVNAANGVANQLCNIVNNFVNNFTQAFNPQITKRYAAAEYDSLMKLLIYGSKYAYFLLLVLALPVFIHAHFILEIWLGQVPEHTVSFVRWIIIFMLAEAVSRPIITAKNATGEIRNYQIVVGGVLLLMLPASYVGLKFGFPVEVVPFCNAATACLAIIARMIMLRGDFPSWSSAVFIKKVLFRVVVVTLIAGIIPILAYWFIDYGWCNFIVTSMLCVLCSGLSIFFVGCDHEERHLIITQAQKLLKKVFKK